MKKIVLGMSGGVDSSLCVLLLKNQGFEVTGVFLDTGSGEKDAALSVASDLGIKLEVIDSRADLDRLVCIPFIDEYLCGRTPNPCVLCNPLLKFPSLLTVADRLNIELIATGHYAAVDFNPDTSLYRLRMNPSGNDQSYMLARLNQAILSRLFLPLSILSKREVRKLADEYGLAAADKPDSMEICFISTGNYADYIEKRGVKTVPGNFIDREGKVLGVHRGIHHYTVGQRRRLGVSAESRLFVSKIDQESGDILLINDADFLTDSISTSNISWISGSAPSSPFRARVRVRHSKTCHDAEVRLTNSGADVFFDIPLRPPAPGQTAVFYDNDIVLGAAIIDP